MSSIVLEAVKRDVTGKKVNALRRAGQLPAVLFGRHIEPIAISLDARSATALLRNVTPSTLLGIKLGSEQHTVLVRDRQYHPLKGSLLHIDFQAVSMTEKLRSQVSLEFVGEASAVSVHGAVLITELTEIEVECLPQDLPETIVVDISGLKEIGQSLHVRDLKVSSAVEVLTDLDDLVVLASRVGEEAEEMVSAISEPEVIEKSKKEDFED